MADSGYATSTRPRKRPRSKPEKVNVMFKAPQKSFEISIYAFWLQSSEYFEAKFERWSSSNENEFTDPLLVELPLGCDPERGAHLFRERLMAAEVKEEWEWDSVRWWKFIAGSEEMLCLALVIFDWTLMENYCEEVVRTLYDFRIDCPAPFGVVAKKYDPRIRHAEPPSASAVAAGPIRDLTSSTLVGLCLALAQGNSSGVKPILDRSIEGCTLEEGWELHSQGLVLLCLVRPLHCDHRPWAEGHLKRFLARRPELGPRQVELFLDAPRSLRRELLPFHQHRLPDKVGTILADMLHVLFLESSRTDLDVERQRDIVDAIPSMARLASPDFETSSKLAPPLVGASAIFEGRISIAGFAIASVAAQNAFMVSVGDNLGKVLCGKVHLVHPQLRYMLLEHFRDLTEPDIACLGTAVFPPRQDE